MRSILSELNAISKEIERRKSKLDGYNSGPVVHTKQIEFHSSLKRNRWVFGGNRSGKTECGAVETVWLLLGNHPFRPNKPDLSGWCVSVSQSVQRDVAQKKILSYLPPASIEKVVMINGSSSSPSYGVIDYIMVRNVFGGLSRLGFKSCEASREKFQGADLDFVWFDEEPPLDIYEECRMRLLDRAGECFATMTPLKGLSWVYDKVYLNPNNDPQIFTLFMEWADNPFLPKSEIDAMTDVMSNDELLSRRYGRFTSGCGLVYPEFDPAVHVIDPFPIPDHWQDNLSIDPGLNNPLSCHWYAVDGDGNIFVVAEHFQAGKDINFHAARIREISRSLNWKTDNSGCVSALIDSAANQRTLSGIKSVTELFREAGIAVNPNVNKDIFSGINRVKAQLMSAEGKPRLFVFSSCVNLIREFKTYSWGAGDLPKKYDDHALDELRYYLQSKPRPCSPSSLPEPSAITRDKLRLSRKAVFERLNNLC